MWTVSVEKRRGRGEVRVVEQPTRRNNYTAVIQIRDCQAARTITRLKCGGIDQYVSKDMTTSSFSIAIYHLSLSHSTRMTNERWKWQMENGVLKSGFNLKSRLAVQPDS